jgi:hypothetical protein
MMRITEQRRPDRGTIGGSSADRDYRMSTYDNVHAVRKVMDAQPGTVIAAELA